MNKILLYIILFTSLTARAQQAHVNNNLKVLVGALTAMANRLPVEKLYLQTDKPYYTLGDTLRFKSYLLNADYLTPATKSGLLYVELDDASNRMIKRIMYPIIAGISWGDIVLLEDEVPEGSYTLRAYTSWMLNFKDAYVFKKNINIAPLNNKSVLINAGFKLEPGVGKEKDKVTANLQFSTFDGNLERLKEMQLRVKAGNKTLFRDNAATGMDGRLQITFDLADKTAINKLSILAQRRGRDADTSVLTIPVTINRADSTDVQFMPEGGNLVAGIATKIGFKAINEDGKGVNVNGIIYNNRQQQIATIQATHKGMGAFELIPQAGESYTATINLANGVTKNYPLPGIKSSGTTLKINPKGKDSLQITANITPDIVASSTYYLIGQSRGVVCYAAAISFKTTVVTKAVAAKLFPTGIAHFTLLNAAKQPLNERIVYIDHQDALKIGITTPTTNYALRDSVALNIQVTDSKGNPVQGAFSLAVTDDEQVRQDTIGSNMINHMLFTADLKGTVEEPGWYFENNEPQHITALDNLLLTQGWVGYDWNQVLDTNKQVAKYKAEKEFMIQGKATNFFNKPIVKTGVTLLQKRPFMAMETVTDENGRFVFKGDGVFPTDTAYYLILAKNKRGNSMNIGVDVDEFIPPVFATPKHKLAPWYVNSDTTLIKGTATKLAQIKAESDYKGEGNMLKEVVIKDKKVIAGSKNRNGPGGADFIVDEKEMKAAKKMTLFEVLKHKFPGFYKKNRFGYFTYYLKARPVVLIIDGLGGNTDLAMDLLTAEDIKGIEVMYNPRYILAYNPEIITMFLHSPDSRVPTYLEITTYSGHGSAIKRMPGRYVYRPAPFIAPKQFYIPRYTVKNRSTAMGTDLRSTIHWEPNVVTDTAGKATISFFNADKATAYTVIMEGTDLDGNIGYKRHKIKVLPMGSVAK